MRAVLHILYRLILHTIISLIAVTIAGLLGVLIIFIANLILEFFGMGVHEIRWIMYIAISAIAGFSGFISGTFGPITVHYKRYHKIPKIRPWMLYIASLIYLAIVIVTVTNLIPNLISEETDTVTKFSNGAFTYFKESPLVLLCISVFYLLFFIFTIGNINLNKCFKCGCVNCYIRTGTSDHNTRTGKDYKYDSYDNNYNVYSSGGSHLGTVSGYGGTYVYKERDITKKTWKEHYECYHCNDRTTINMSDVTKSEWHNPSSEKKWWKD